MSDDLKSWQVPPQASTDDRKLAWLNECVEEGQSWLKTQRGSDDWQKALDIFSSRTDVRDIPKYRSQLTTARLKRNIKEVVGACANIRPIWAYSSDNSALSDQAAMMNTATRAIYLERFLDLGIKRTLQWSALTCTGWLRPVYRRNMYGHGKGNLTFLTYGQPSVLPVQLPASNDWQEAYAITILDELPVAMAHGMFPRFQEKLRPTSSKYWYAPEIRQAAKGNLFQRMFGKWGREKGSPLTDLLIPVRYTYVIDLSLNTTDAQIPMGEIGSSWFYNVPYVGQTLADGRIATENDARLYPYRRLIISSQDCVMYDGPAFDWHGEFPAIPFCLDDWAWEAIGFSITRDGYALQQSINELERGVMDKHRAALDPAMGYDINSVTKNEADSFDPMQPRSRVGFDGSLVERPFVPVIPEENLKVDPMTMQFIEHLEQTADYQLAIRDIIALAKARSMGGGVDDAEQVMQADGPIVRDISRSVERAICGVGEQCKYLILQYYNTRRLMTYVGADGVTLQTFDYDPNKLVPSHMPGEKPDVPSTYSQVERARMFAENLRLSVTPHSAHELTQMSMKLGLIQLRKAGIQIDSRTIAEAWDIPFGNKPEGNTVWDRYWNEQEAVAQHAIRVKQLVDSIMQMGVNPTPAMLSALGEIAGVPPREGRPPSGQSAPTLQSKDGGERSTISESGS